MSASPTFTSTPRLLTGRAPATADTSLTGPTNATTLTGTIPAAGTQIDELVAIGVGTTVAGVLTVFLHDGTNFHLYDVFLVPAVTPSTTVAPWRESRRYSNLIVPSGWTLRFAVSVAGLQSLVDLVALGADLT